MGPGKGKFRSIACQAGKCFKGWELRGFAAGWPTNSGKFFYREVVMGFYGKGGIWLAENLNVPSAGPVQSEA